MSDAQQKAGSTMPTGPNREAVTLAPGSEQEPTKVGDLHPGDTTHPSGSWVDFSSTRGGYEKPSPWAGGTDWSPTVADVRLVPGGQVYWGAGQFRTSALPEKWHVNSDGAVDAGE